MNTQQTEAKDQLQNLKQFFSTLGEYPDRLRIEYFAVITNVPKFIQNHVGLIQHNIGKPRLIAPYLQRLEKVARILERRQKDRGSIQKAA